MPGNTGWKGLADCLMKTRKAFFYDWVASWRLARMLLA